MKRFALAMAALLCACSTHAADKPYLSNIGPQGPGPVYLIDPTTGLAVTPNGSASAPGYVQTPTPSTIAAGQGRIATASTAVCLPSAALQNGIVVKALGSNGGSLTLGGAGVTPATDGTGNGYVLAPGEAMSLAVANANLVCFNGSTAGDGVSYAGN